ncbi:MAG: 50S ribosome-binding GTPase [Rhodospirillales bacterium]|nr:50S ribosome-binding GTPase [Rhodospirillales bacterium]
MFGLFSGKNEFKHEDLEKAKAAIIEEFSQRPPTIGVIGVSGTGKSSTINAFFGTDLAISHVVACTKDFWNVDLGSTLVQGPAQGKKVTLRVVDAPGLGEDVSLDPGYLEMYLRHLPGCDVILWISTARNRAIALDQQYLAKLAQFHDRMVFGINQIDLVEPMDWQRINCPSDEQERNVNLIVEDRQRKLESITGKEINVVPYCAARKYNLQELFTAAVKACDPKRAWLFSAIKSFSPTDFIPVEVRQRVVNLVDKNR